MLPPSNSYAFAKMPIPADPAEETPPAMLKRAADGTCMHLLEMDDFGRGVHLRCEPGTSRWDPFMPNLPGRFHTDSRSVSSNPTSADEDTPMIDVELTTVNAFTGGQDSNATDGELPAKSSHESSTVTQHSTSNDSPPRDEQGSGEHEVPPATINAAGTSAEDAETIHSGPAQCGPVSKKRKGWKGLTQRVASKMRSIGSEICGDHLKHEPTPSTSILQILEIEKEASKRMKIPIKTSKKEDASLFFYEHFTPAAVVRCARYEDPGNLREITTLVMREANGSDFSELGDIGRRWKMDDYIRTFDIRARKKVLERIKGKKRPLHYSDTVKHIEMKIRCCYDTGENAREETAQRATRFKHFFSEQEWNAEENSVIRGCLDGAIEAHPSVPMSVEVREKANAIISANLRLMYQADYFRAILGLVKPQDQTCLEWRPPGYGELKAPVWAGTRAATYEREISAARLWSPCGFGKSPRLDDVWRSRWLGYSRAWAYMVAAILESHDTVAQRRACEDKCSYQARIIARAMNEVDLASRDNATAYIQERLRDKSNPPMADELRQLMLSLL